MAPGEYGRRNVNADRTGRALSRENAAIFLSANRKTR